MKEVGLCSSLYSIPTWSFIYRNMIKNLQHNFRCIALDYLGFGLSMASDGFIHTLKDHSDIVRLFIQALELNEVTMMVHDIGGRIGLGVAGKQSEGFHALVRVGISRNSSMLTFAMYSKHIT
jgi:haloalkane dehalogenase